MGPGERDAFSRLPEVQQKVRGAGAYCDSQRLQTADTATTQRVRDQRVLTTDGPFAETKETLAGFYVIEVEDLDQALDWAARLPSARIGSVEVRPIMSYS